MNDVLVIKLGYCGADFNGFAYQESLRTVQGELQRALATFFHRPFQVVCAGRTDAGVHALAQYVTCELEPSEWERCEPKRLLRALQALVPDDIAVYELFKAPAGFSARFSAISRTYCYRIFPHQFRPIHNAKTAWWYRGDLNVERMQEAGKILIGEHDFKSFCKLQSALDKPTHRFVAKLEVKRTVELDEKLIALTIEGNAFLHSMVRTIVGTLVEVGRGHRDVQWVQRVLEARDRTKAGQTAPACGLTFVRVRYPEASFIPYE